jgi:hypothetical protein
VARQKRRVELGWWTPRELVAVLGLKDAANPSRKHLWPLVTGGRVERRYPENPAHAQQAYRAVGAGAQRAAVEELLAEPRSHRLRAELRELEPEANEQRSGQRGDVRHRPLRNLVEPLCIRLEPLRTRSQPMRILGRETMRT